MSELEYEPIVAHAEAIVENATYLEKAKNAARWSGVLALPTTFGVVAIEAGDTFAQQFGTLLAVPTGAAMIGVLAGAGVDLYFYHRDARNL